MALGVVKPSREQRVEFSEEDIRSILDGTKTQIRKACVKSPPDGEGFDDARQYETGAGWKWWRRGGQRYSDLWPDEGEPPVYCPFGRVGSFLWVPEKFLPCTQFMQPVLSTKKAHHVVFACGDVQYRNGNYVVDQLSRRRRWLNDLDAKLMRNIYMPRWASRITLEITRVRIVRGEGGGWEWVVDFKKLRPEDA